MGAPPRVVELVETFGRNLEAYRSGHYKETRLRREFIDPVFKALGWDVDNERGYAEAYKDVVHEDAIQVGGATKAPDYCFRIGGTRKFFLEAKKPSVDIRGGVHPAYQLRRYAWSAKLPLSLLTDFEELAVYDCRLRPSRSDGPATARIQYLTYDHYPGRWDELAAVFSRDAVLKGSFDRYADSTRAKRGTAEVDDAFLAEIETWREALARNLALRNPQLSQRELNFAVQRTIDRIIFLRICEDRGIEPYGQLQALLNGERVYPRLFAVFQRADERYNSGLFHFQPEPGRPDEPDRLTPALELDDKALKDIFRGLYYPDSPYEFAVLPADILGQVYEQFLGRIIRLTPGHRARVEEKPEVRKAGGVYYTPTYIVDYIVDQTVGRLLEGKTPRAASRIRILDPACGSGSFLLGAYQRLLDWHRDYYLDHHTQTHARARRLYQGRGGEWRLTAAERKRILLNNIYGVDIDPQAVEVTKLSLLLKVLEGESGEALETQLKLFHQRALPDLGENIKCGNSLVGPDFYRAERQGRLFDEDEVLRINAFDWHAEFPRIFRGRNPGFHAVIGNPPYVRMEGFTQVKSYLREHYEAHEERADLYVYFLERGLRLLNRSGGLGMIVSNKFIKAKYGRPLRQFIADRASVELVADFAGANVFPGATVRTVVLVLARTERRGKARTVYVPVPDPNQLASLAAGSVTVSDHAAAHSWELHEAAISADEWQLAPAEHAAVVEKMRAGACTLQAWLGTRATFGIKTGYNAAFIVDRATRDRLVASEPESADILKPILFGKDIRRYRVGEATRFVIYCHPNRDIAQYPAVREYLAPHVRRLKGRAGSHRWFELQQPAVALLDRIANPKMVYPIIAPECRFAIDNHGYLINDKSFMLATDDLPLLGLLNSSCANFYFAAVCAALEGSRSRYLEFRAQFVDRFPVPKPFSNWPRRHELADLVQLMLALHERRVTAKTAHECSVVERQIAATDAEIDRLVYELYGLTDDEIAIVEEATAPNRGPS